MLRETVAVSAMLCALVPALVPMAQPGVPATHDGFLHAQRLIALEAAVRQGTPFTRWLPDLAYGYGQPLLLYYAPLAYLPALVARFLGAGYGLSFQIADGLALVLSALAMYLLARSFVGPPAACAAAVVYGLLPYQLVDVYVRGALAESWAFVWLPLCAWCLLEAWRDGRRRWSVGLALGVAGLVLTHNATALLFLPALLALAAVLWLGGQGRPAPWAVPVAIGLGLVLSAWFWLPAIVERGLVQITETLEPELFASFFLRSWPPFQLDPLFDYQRPVSVALGSPIYWPRLGLVQVLVTLAGLVAGLRRSGILRLLASWATLLVVGGIVLQAGSLAPLYDMVPLLAFVQFPWRLLALVGLGSAILAGLLVETASPRTDIRAIFAGVVVVVSLVTAVGRLQPEMTPVDERTLSVETIQRIELADYGLGSTHSGEYLPVSSGQRNAARFRKTMLDAGGGSRPAEARPSDLRVERVDWRPDRIVAEVEAPRPDRLVLHQFAFPGWTARVDGSPVPTVAVGQLGLLAVDVPAGQHLVEFAWGLTPLRLWAAAISLFGVVALAVLASLRGWLPRLRPLIGGLVVAGLLAALLLPSWSGVTPTRAASTVGKSTSQQVDDTLTLVDVQQDASRLASDRLALLRLTWLVRRPPSAAYRAQVEILAANGTSHRVNWGYEPLSRLWERNELVPTTIALRLPPDFPSGAAQLRLVFERPDGVPPAVLGSLAVPRLAASPELDAAGPSIDIRAETRLSAVPTRAGTPPQVKVGRLLDVPLRWRELAATPNVDRELQVVGVIHAPSGDILSEPRRPGDWFMPQPFWQTGEVVEQRLRIEVPPRTSPGSYPLSVRVYDRELARGGASEPGASSARPRGRPIEELMIGTVTVTP